jgi:hypothetical protein
METAGIPWVRVSEVNSVTESLVWPQREANYSSAATFLRQAASLQGTLPSGTSRIRITETNGEVRLSWPATGTNFVLEAKDSLARTNWSEVSQPPALHDNECVVTQTVSTASQFYRLRRR